MIRLKRQRKEMEGKKGKGEVEESVEEIYLKSAHSMRTSFPKFVIFLGAATLVWIVGTLLLIPLGRGTFVNELEASQIVNLILIAAVLVLIFASFKEIRSIADACAGFVTYYVGNDRKGIAATRVRKLRGTFRSFAYVILVSLLFIMFKSLLDQVHPALAGVFVIVIAVWVIVALYSVVMAMSSEIEEAAVGFTAEIERVIKARKQLASKAGKTAKRRRR
jgi:hypothetical protein